MWWKNLVLHVTHVTKPCNTCDEKTLSYMWWKNLVLHVTKPCPTCDKTLSYTWQNHPDCHTTFQYCLPVNHVTKPCNTCDKTLSTCDKTTWHHDIKSLTDMWQNLAEKTLCFLGSPRVTSPLRGNPGGIRRESPSSLQGGNSTRKAENQDSPPFRGRRSDQKGCKTGSPPFRGRRSWENLGGTI